MQSGRRLRVLEALAAAAVLGAAALLLWWAAGGGMWWELFSDRQRLRGVIGEADPWAPILFVSLLVVQAVLAPLPAPALAAAGGYLFGTVEGFLLTWAGALVGGMLCFALSRALGRDFVRRSTRLEGLDRYVEEHGAILVFVLRLIPLISFDAISYAAGLTGISFWRFLIATALGAAPGTFVFVYLGGASPEPGLYAAFIGLAILAVAAYAVFRRVMDEQ